MATSFYYAKPEKTSPKIKRERLIALPRILVIQLFIHLFLCYNPQTVQLKQRFNIHRFPLLVFLFGYHSSD